MDRKQSSLDFVDVDVHNDVPLFVDPHALQLLPSAWAAECSSLVHDFFRTVVNAIRDGEHDQARSLLSALREPNETHLGLSSSRSRGRALGHDSAKDVWEALRKSEAVKAGLIEDLEDTILMVEGIDRDIVSDIATDLIREPLIHYTQDACRFYGIPMEPEVASGPLWNPTRKEWHECFVELPTVDGKRLLLVPKAIVRRGMHYTAAEYYRHYILESLRQEELRDPTSSLVRLVKGGPRVTLKSLKEKYGFGKRMIVRQTLRNPDLLRQYREDKQKRIPPPLSHLELGDSGASLLPDWDKLLEAVTLLPTGADAASSYERAIEALLAALFYPALTNPQPQVKIHDGRKRIDITYTNVADAGFFRWLSLHYTAPHVFVECKNYGKEIGNPELDQLAGRFSPSRGQFGLIVCRSLADKPLFIQRCIDTAKDHRGFIVPLDDGDLRALIGAAKSVRGATEFELLRDRFQQLIR